MDEKEKAEINKLNAEAVKLRAEANKLIVEAESIKLGDWTKWYTALISTFIGGAGLLKIIKEFLG